MKPFFYRCLLMIFVLHFLSIQIFPVSLQAMAAQSEEKTDKPKIEEKATDPTLQFRHSTQKDQLKVTIWLSEEHEVKGDWMVTFQEKEKSWEDEGNEVSLDLDVKDLQKTHQIQAQFQGNIDGQEQSLTAFYVFQPKNTKHSMVIQQDIDEKEITFTSTLANVKKAKGDWKFELNGNEQRHKDKNEKVTVTFPLQLLAVNNQLQIQFSGLIEGSQITLDIDHSFIVKGMEDQEKEVDIQIDLQSVKDGVELTLALDHAKKVKGEWAFELNGKKLEEKGQDEKATITLSAKQLQKNNQFKVVFTGEVDGDSVTYSKEYPFTFDKESEKELDDRIEISHQMTEEGVELTTTIGEGKEVAGSWMFTLNGEPLKQKGQGTEVKIKVASSGLQPDNTFAAVFIGQVDGKAGKFTKPYSFTYEDEHKEKPEKKIDLAIQHELLDNEVILTAQLDQGEQVKGIWRFTLNGEALSKENHSGKQASIHYPLQTLDDDNQVTVTFSGQIDGKERTLSKEYTFSYNNKSENENEEPAVIEMELQVNRQAEGVKIVAELLHSGEICGDWFFTLNDLKKEHTDCQGGKVEISYPATQLKEQNQVTVVFEGTIDGLSRKISKQFQFEWEKENVNDYEFESIQFDEPSNPPSIQSTPPSSMLGGPLPKTATDAWKWGGVGLAIVLVGWIFVTIRDSKQT